MCVHSGLKDEAALSEPKGEMNIKERKTDEEGNGRVYQRFLFLYSGKYVTFKSCGLFV